MVHFVDMARLAGESDGRGSLWGTESQDLDCTVVAWAKGEGVAEHTNDEVDVVMVVQEGRVLVELPRKSYQLMAGQVLLIGKGTRRRIEGLSDRVVYLSVHRRRRPMTLGVIEDYRDRIL